VAHAYGLEIHRERLRLIAALGAELRRCPPLIRSMLNGD
jgi:hypothetical protein